MTNQPRNDASHGFNRGSFVDFAAGVCFTCDSHWPGIRRGSLWGSESYLSHGSLLPLLIIACLLAFATRAPAQPVNPLAIVVAQRDAAIRQRDALFAERNALRDERRETLRVCRQHGMPADGDLPTWLGEVLREGTERWEWCRVFVRSED